MQNKILLLLFLFISSLTQAQVVTNKKEAIKKGIYEKPVEKKLTSQTTVATTQTPQKSVSKPIAMKTAKPTVKRKKIVINDNGDEDLIVGPAENYLAVQMINNAMEFLGVNYRGGGTTVAGMDCSGMVTAVFNIFGLKLPRSSTEMAKIGARLNQDEIKKGDLVFFKTNGRGISHVGMVVEANGDDIKFIHSSTHEGVIISSIKEPYYTRTFVQANRVIM